MNFIILIAALAAGDLLIKERIENQDQETFPRSLKGMEGKLTIHKFHNQGLPFGFLKERQDMVRLIPLMVVSALAGILGWILPRKGNQAAKLGLSIAIGGALSNLYDRYVRHYVVDYVTLEVGCLKRVIFNMGDVFVFLGTVLLFLSECLQEWKEWCRKRKE